MAMGRPRIELSDKEWEQLEELCRIQCTAEEVCGVLQISQDTLGRRIKEKYGITFAEYFKRFAEYGKSSLRRAQFRLAETSATMAIWLGKQYLGQKDRQEVEMDNTVKYVFECDDDLMA